MSRSRNIWAACLVIALGVLYVCGYGWVDLRLAMHGEVLGITVPRFLCGSHCAEGSRCVGGASYGFQCGLPCVSNADCPQGRHCGCEDYARCGAPPSDYPEHLCL